MNSHKLVLLGSASVPASCASGATITGGKRRNWTASLKVGAFLGLAAFASSSAFAQEVGLFGAVSPASRSVQIGQEATAFATMINSSATPATNCKIAQSGSSVGAFSFQATDPLTNSPIGIRNAAVDIPAGASQSFMFSITPNSPMNGSDLSLAFSCDGFSDAPVFSGVNTLTLSASTQAVPDVIAITATQNLDQIVDIAGLGKFTAYSAAAVNIGADGDFDVKAEYTGSNAPVTALLCETDPTSGACLAPPSAKVQSSILSGDISTFAVFALRNAEVAFDPANNRIRLRFTDSNSLIAGEAGIAARGTGTDLVIGNYIATANGFTVNGVSYTNGAADYTRILDDGALSGAARLSTGKRVRVVGTKSSGAADTISIDTELAKGPITALSTTTFDVAGQTINFDPATVFQNRLFADLQTGDYVEVDGVFDASGNIQASRIEYLAGGFAEARHISVVGKITDLNSALKTFMIQNLTVQYTNASLDRHFVNGQFANGDVVEAKSNAVLAGLTLNANRIERAHSEGKVGQPGVDVELEGIVDRFVSVQDFDINGQPVLTNVNTVFEHGLASDITLNSKIEAEGLLNGSNVLEASKVSIKNGNDNDHNDNDNDHNGNDNDHNDNDGDHNDNNNDHNGNDNDHNDNDGDH
ncbi:MAG: hypothetical protein JKY46_08335 [Robiginitomaculum sp.]|nr:hypothetical protein [Robiginitomaculum sp.]